MKIEKLNENNIADVYCCLGERRELFKDDINEAVGYMREHLRLGWLAYAVYNDAGNPIGMAILIPSSDPLSPVTGENIYYFHCMDINKEWRNQGIGKELIEKIVEEVEIQGGKGLVVDSFGEYWMSNKFFTKIGFETVKTFPEHSLLLKRITQDAQVEFIEMPYRGDLPGVGIQVDIQHSVTCPYILNNYRKVKEMVKKIDHTTVIRERIINNKEDVAHWGGSGVYVNGKSVSAGPVDEETLRKAIAEAKGKA